MPIDLTQAPKSTVLGTDTAKFEKLKLWRLKDKPTYFSAEIEDTTQISSTTEDAIILSSSDAKQQAVAFLKSIADREDKADDYNSLLEEYITQQASNSDAIISEISTITDKFDSFRTKAMKGTNDSETMSNGLAPPVQAMVRGMGRLDSKSRREKFHKTFGEAAKVQFVKGEIELVKKECNSWIRVFMSYPAG